MSPAECRLCGLVCGPHPIVYTVAAEEHSFCCLGCMNVYLILFESGVVQSGQDLKETEIFRRSRELGLVAQGDAASKSVADSAPMEAGRKELVLRLSGLWCTSCAWLIEHVLRGKAGVSSVRVSFASDLVTVTYSPQKLSPQEIAATIRHLGYGASEYTGEQDISQREQRDLFLRFGVAAFLWANIMSLSLALYAGYLDPLSPSVRHYLPFVLMALSIPVLVYCASPIFRVALYGLRHLSLRMETLIAVGTLAAFGYSAVAAFRGGPHFYFDTVSVIITLVLAGKLIERTAKQKATRWISTLHQYTPKKARVLAKGIERFVAVSELALGTVLLIKPGERIPVDGVVVEGESHVDESLLTGESAPVPKGVSATVAAGTVNLSGILHVRMTRTADHSLLSQILAQVEHALSTRSAVERMVDRVARVFVPAVILLSGATLAWLMLHGHPFSEAMMRAIAVLIIACPCALGLATPLAITAAMGVASRHGVLIAESNLLERLPRIDAIVLDKTGTITEGKYSLVAMEPATHSELRDSVLVNAGSSKDSAPASASRDNNDDLRVAASLERYSEHPLANALVAAANHEGLTLLDAKEVRIHQGAGISGVVAGELVFLGNRKLLDEIGIAVEERLLLSAAERQKRGDTVSFFGRSGNVRALCIFGDRIKEEAITAVDCLRRKGIEVHLVSGDAEATTSFVAGQLGIEHYASEVDPMGKALYVERLQCGSRLVAAVGDGINDAPALARANLGVAMGSGTDLAMKAAGIVLMDDRIEHLPFVLGLAKRALTVIRQNLFWAFVYNFLGIGLAMTGVLNPILAAVAMLLSSASILANTARIRRVWDAV